MVPHDSAEVLDTDRRGLSAIYTNTAYWYHHPVPVPTPPSFFYFQFTFPNSKDKEHACFRDIIVGEFSLLFLGAWWH